MAAFTLPHCLLPIENEKAILLSSPISSHLVFGWTDVDNLYISTILTRACNVRADAGKTNVKNRCSAGALSSVLCLHCAFYRWNVLRVSATSVRRFLLSIA